MFRMFKIVIICNNFGFEPTDLEVNRSRSMNLTIPGPQIQSKGLKNHFLWKKNWQNFINEFWITFGWVWDHFGGHFGSILGCLLEQFGSTLGQLLDHFGICICIFFVRRGLEMIRSHGAPSSLDMSSYQAIWTIFRSNSMIFINWIFKKHISELQISGHLPPQSSGRRKTWCQETLCHLSRGTGWYLASWSCLCSAVLRPVPWLRWHS